MAEEIWEHSNGPFQMCQSFVCPVLKGHTVIHIIFNSSWHPSGFKECEKCRTSLWLVGLRGPSWATECLGTIFGTPLVSAPLYLELLMIFPDCFASLSRFSHDALSFSFPACISFVFLFNSFKFLLDQNFTGQPRDDVSNLWYVPSQADLGGGPIMMNPTTQTCSPWDHGWSSPSGRHGRYKLL